MGRDGVGWDVGEGGLCRDASTLETKTGQSKAALCFTNTPLLSYPHEWRHGISAELGGGLVTFLWGLYLE